jgi:hypothetical protein
MTDILLLLEGAKVIIIIIIILALAMVMGQKKVPIL